LLSEGGEGTNDDYLDYQVSGIGLEQATAIAYRNLTLYLAPDSKFHHAAQYAVESAEDLYGKDSPQARSTLDAWDAVGIYLYPRLVSNKQALTYSTPVGRSDSLLITLTNEGMEALTVEEFQLTDAGNYSVTMDPALPLELGSSDSVKLNVKFSPSGERSYADTLILRSTDPRDPIKRIPLTGIGLDSTTSVVDRISRPTAEVNVFPNPFTNQLTVSYRLPGNDFVTLEILDITGRLVYSASWETMAKGKHLVNWGDISRGNTGFGKGLFLLKLRTGNQVLTKKIIRE
jgi:hypothetical protein